MRRYLQNLVRIEEGLGVVVVCKDLTKHQPVQLSNKIAVFLTRCWYVSSHCELRYTGLPIHFVNVLLSIPMIKLIN